MTTMIPPTPAKRVFAPIGSDYQIDAAREQIQSIRRKIKAAQRNRLTSDTPEARAIVLGWREELARQELIVSQVRRFYYDGWKSKNLQRNYEWYYLRYIRYFRHTYNKPRR